MAMIPLLYVTCPTVCIVARSPVDIGIRGALKAKEVDIGITGNNIMPNTNWTW